MALYVHTYIVIFAKIWEISFFRQQIRGFGLYMNDITQKFERSPEYSTDLSLDDFQARKSLVKQVQDNNNAEQLPWTPILSHYEVTGSDFLLP